MEMLEAAKEGNWDQLPMVVSGYRTQKKQQQLYDDKVAGYRKEGNSQSEAEELAKQGVSVPGYSEHQIGLAVDINGATYDLYFWLQENSYKYGFIYRYPGDKTDITGVAEEVWHYRYVGVEAATEMYEKGLCLEEYLAERQAEQWKDWKSLFCLAAVPGVYDLSEASGTITNELLSRLGSRLNRMIV